jgi:hypothetical protein
MKLIKLNGKNGNGLYAQVSDEDYDWLNKLNWHVCKCANSNTLYVMGRLEKGRGPKISMHRAIMKPADSFIHIDHIDHNGLNNQRSNLREATVRQNAGNKLKIKTRKGILTSSKYTGVQYRLLKKKWTWITKCIGKHKSYTRNFNTEVEAAMWYNELATKCHGEFACHNILTKEDQVIYNKIIQKKEKNNGKYKCSICKEYLLPESFLENKRNKKRNGLESYCKNCKNKRRRELRKNKKNESETSTTK